MALFLQSSGFQYPFKMVNKKCTQQPGTGSTNAIWRAKMHLAPALLAHLSIHPRITLAPFATTLPWKFMLHCSCSTLANSGSEKAGAPLQEIGHTCLFKDGQLLGFLPLTCSLFEWVCLPSNLNCSAQQPCCHHLPSCPSQQQRFYIHFQSMLKAYGNIGHSATTPIC